MTPTIFVALRGDDAGSCHSADSAILEACECGALLNVSIMACGPTFAAFADAWRRSGTNAALGLHVTLNAEWETVKWRPLSPPEAIPTLLDADGFFLPTPQDLHERKASTAEMLREVEAQCQRIQAAGLTLTYLDEHMGVGWLPGLREGLREIARREHLSYADDVPPLPESPDVLSDPVENLLHRIEHAPPGTYRFVTHPGRDADDMREFFHRGLAPGQIALERSTDRLLLCDARLLHAEREGRVCWSRFGR